MRPLTSSPADRELLVGRDELIAEGARRLGLGGNLLLHGQPGAGTTTVRNHVVAGLRVLHTGMVDDLDGLLYALDRDRPTVATPVDTDAADRLARLDVDVIAIDEPAGPLPTQFAALRDTWWGAAPIRWVVTTHTGDHLEWTRRPIDTFFDVIEIGPLSDDDAIDLLNRHARRLPSADAATLVEIAPTIVAISDGLPGTVIRAARTALSTPDPRAWAQDQQAISAAVAGLGAAHHAVLNHLRNHGPTSASDPDLQAAVGVTRGRIAQLLGDLTDHAAVSRQREGRRVLYSLTAHPHPPDRGP